MFGGYHQGQEEMPRVIHISVTRYRRELPQPGEPLEFLVAIHEEGTGITWQQNVAVQLGNRGFSNRGHQRSVALECQPGPHTQ